MSIASYDPRLASPAEVIASLDEPLRSELLAKAAGGAITDEAVMARLMYDWSFWGRPKQQAPPGDWFIWLNMAGRGFGKTRSLTEWIRLKKETVGRLAIVARTAADYRDVIIEGDSGLLATAPPWDRPEWIPARRMVRWSNGAFALCFSAEEPDQMRGPQFGGAACDEVAAWRYVEAAISNLMFGMRAAKKPQVAMGTTPRPIPYIKELLELSNDPTSGVVVTTGTTFENFGNLPERYINHIVKRYLGTRLGQQELLAVVLGDTPGALWTRELIEASRVSRAPTLRRLVVGVDPNASSSESAAETGIVAVGIDARPTPHLYVMDDKTLRGSPAEWAGAVVELYNRVKADRVVAEKNNGGDMVDFTLRSVQGGRDLPVRLVWASKGKFTRAEPVSALYEQKRVHHVGLFAELEDQQCTWVPGQGDSPDRVDALVWAATDLIIDPEVGPAPGVVASALATRGAARSRIHVPKRAAGHRRLPV